jgi:hypothetical protein
LDPMGNLVNAEVFKDRTYKDFNDYWFRFYQDDEANPNWQTEPKIDYFVFTIEDYQEIKEEIINEIKKNPQDWKIEGENGLIVVRSKSGRKHYFSKYGRTYSEDSYEGFKEEEWQTIENALNSQRNNKILGYLGSVILLVAVVAFYIFQIGKNNRN